MTPRIDVEDATNKADLLEQEVRIFKLQAKLNRLNERQTHVSDGGCAGLQDLIDEYGEEFNKLSKTIKDQKTEIAHQEQTIESLYKATNASQAVVKEHRGIKPSMNCVSSSTAQEQIGIGGWTRVGMSTRSEQRETCLSMIREC